MYTRQLPSGSVQGEVCATQHRSTHWAAVRCAHRLPRVPLEDLAPTILMDGHVPIELDGVPHVEALNLPGVAKIEPVVWLLMLEAVLDELQPGTPDCMRSCCTGLQWPGTQESERWAERHPSRVQDPRLSSSLEAWRLAMGSALIPVNSTWLASRPCKLCL